MNAKTEQEQIIADWRQKAVDDLESAEILFKQTNKYDIVAFHAHQAVEKALKAGLIREGQAPRRTHDLQDLLVALKKRPLGEEVEIRVIALNILYPVLRYPTGDAVTRDQAAESIATAKLVLAKL